jgi:predicted lipid carrier protein YhbT
MRELGLAGAVRGKVTRTTVPAATVDARPDDLVQRVFRSSAPNRLWVAELERHEAPWIRVEVRDLHRWVVAAARLELRAV